MHYRNTFYPGTPSLDEAQAMRVGPDLAINDVHITVPTERTYSITGKVLSGVGQPHLKNAEVTYERVDEAGYTFEAAGQTVQLTADHSFTFSSLYSGDYTLGVKKVVQNRMTDLGFASVRIVDSNVRADVEVGRVAEVHGRTQGPEGLSLTGKKITLETWAFIYCISPPHWMAADASRSRISHRESSGRDAFGKTAISQSRSQMA
jgi:hypothetical protein